MTSNSGIDIRNENHVILPDFYFNGEVVLLTGSMLSEFHIRIETQLAKNFTLVNNNRVEFLFEGDLYHNTGQSKVFQ